MRGVGPFLAAFLVVFGVAVYGSSVARAEDLTARIEQAHAAFWRHDYDAAAEIYQELLDRYRIENPVVLYNLATIWAHQGRLGLALWGWQRALKLGASGELADDIHHDLDAARAALLDRYRDEVAGGTVVLSEPRSFAWQTFHQLDGPALGWAAGILWALGWLAVLVVRLRPTAGLRLQATAATFAVLGVLAAAYYAGNRLTDRDVTMAVVVAPDAKLREGRAPDAPAHALPEGMEVEVVGQALPHGEGLVEVKLPNGTRGWVDASAIRTI